MSNTATAFYRGLAIVSLLTAFVSRAGAETLVKQGFEVPETIRISRELRPHVEAMLETSETFRQQFARIAAAPKLIINARVDLTFMQRGFRARSCMRRYDSGLLVVSMEIGPGGMQAEWIAHEFEHVIEQLDGLRLPALAARGRSDTWFSSGEMVETKRATRAGRTVADEMRARRDRSDKFVE